MPALMHWLRCNRCRVSSLLSDTLDTYFSPPPKALGLAVSGGGDSVGLLVLARDWAEKNNVRLAVATVDHGLRPDAKAEAAGVATLCASWGIAHETLLWSTHEANGNLMDQARRARYRLLSDWATRHGLSDIALGHTRNDNEETFLMGLARGAGLDGLAGMRRHFPQGDVTFHRPLLDVSREDLRLLLRERDIAWVDDPTNEDTDFERVKIRQALAVLAPLELQIGKSIDNLYRTRRDLASDLWARIEGSVAVTGPEVTLPLDTFEGLSADHQRRFLNATLRYLSGADYAPRGQKVQRLLETGFSEAVTLHGCALFARKAKLHIARELAAVAELRAAPNESWDGHWMFSGPSVEGANIAALGEKGLRQIGASWRENGYSRRAMLSVPAIWHKDLVIFAPFCAKNTAEWQILTAPDTQGLQSFVLTH